MADFLAASALVASQTVNKTEDFSVGKFMSFSSAISFMIAIVAFILAWKCNCNKDTLTRIIWSLLAAIFGMYYLVWYLIAHKALPAMMDINKPDNEKFFPCDEPKD